MASLRLFDLLIMNLTLFGLVIAIEFGEKTITSESTSTPGIERKVCYGSDNGLSKVTYESGAIKRLRNMYSNCTIVYGNLEIVGITYDNMQKEGFKAMNFFDKIEEVVGYVLIANNQVPSLSFPRLRIIWGDKLFAPQLHGTGTGTGSNNIGGNYSLFVIYNAVEYLDMRSLRGVIEGRVGVFDNADGSLCHWKTKAMDWTEVLGKNYRSTRYLDHIDNNDSCFHDPEIEVCSASCKHSHCWAHGEEFCQEVYRKNCGPQCRNGMCFNETDPLSCCSPECAAGCFGPTNRQCYGCRAMRDEGVCVDKCPSKELYDVKSAVYMENPNGKYAWNRECVKRCPDHMFIYKEGCVARCPDGYYFEDNDTVCKPCLGQCPKVCSIEKAITSLNIRDLTNCTIVEGFIEIRHDTMIGGADLDANSKFVRYDGVTLDELEILSSIERITQYLLIQSSSLRSLKFLRNLRMIDGKKKTIHGRSLEISACDGLIELGLRGLTRVMDGDVGIISNRDLCYAESVDWKRIAQASAKIALDKNRPNSECRELGLICDDECNNATGCWGAGARMCLQCRHYEFNGTCIRDCDERPNLYAVGKTCRVCHEQCDGCNGPGPEHCKACKYAQLNGVCVERCPVQSHYVSGQRCTLCHASCFDKGCTGPGNFIGDGGCNECNFGVVDNNTIVSCLPYLSQQSSTDNCRIYAELSNFYVSRPPDGLKHRLILACLKCNDVCKSCDMYGVEENYPFHCQCKEYRVNSVPGKSICAAKCPSNTYAKMTSGGPGNPIECYPCHEDCEICYGAESTQCYSCRRPAHVDFLSGNSTQFNCTKVCPPERSFVSNNTCTEPLNGSRTSEIIAGIAFCLIFLIAIIGFTAAFIWRRRYRNTRYLEPDEKIEVNPNAKPNVARLNLILEKDLRRGRQLGSGAFGAVYEGKWRPADGPEKYVAIKVLHKDTASAQEEMLKEAAFMASMDHEYLLSLTGICLGSQLMLVTPLVSLGNLLDYVQNNKSKIGSKALLRWCMQIARGMEYLEEHRLVHRDLAARNVLVNTPYRVQITDFGLARMLDYGEEEIKSAGEKMPIKWLALECIQFRRYTHKSDVWAYAVTVWELLTFGDKPYKDVKLSEIQYLLEQGKRLPQPDGCTMELYLLLIKCWAVEANVRPSFKKLTEEFTRMMKDPGRYLDIKGDSLRHLPNYTAADQKQMLERVMGDQDLDEILNNSNLSPTTPTSLPFPGNDCILDFVDATSLREVAGNVRCGQRQHSTSGRYASDPVEKACVAVVYNKQGEVEFLPSPTTDVDNYLVPDQRNTRVTYTPLVESQSEQLNDETNDRDETLNTNLLPTFITSSSLVKQNNPTNGEYYEHLKATITGFMDSDVMENGIKRFDNRVYTNAQATDENSFKHQGHVQSAVPVARVQSRVSTKPLKQEDCNARIPSSSHLSTEETESVV